MTLSSLSELSDEELIKMYKQAKLDEVINYNLQLAMKLLLNGGYGALANIWFLYYMLENAEAITLTGQAVNRYVNTRLEKFLQKLSKTDKPLWIMADTDSGYFCFDYIVKLMCPDETDKQVITDKLDTFVKQIVQPKIDELTAEFAVMMNSLENRMVYEREVIADTTIVCAKKKYVMSVIDNEGVRYKSPKYKITGMESKKSSTPGWARDFLKEAYILGLKGDEKALQARVFEIKDAFNKLPISTIAIPRGVNNIKEYTDPATGLYIKGTPKHVKAAIIHNWLVKQKGLDVDPLQSGNKLKFVELKKPNPINQEVIGFETHLPKEFELDKYVDREVTFNSAFLNPLQIFLNPIKWNHEETISLEDFFS
jgi:DNA polymerase elongation subunit (family B)